jgi:hypothetical protein
VLEPTLQHDATAAVEIWSDALGVLAEHEHVTADRMRVVAVGSAGTGGALQVKETHGAAGRQVAIFGVAEQTPDQDDAIYVYF